MMAMKIGSKLENAAKLSDEINPLVAGFYFKVGELVFSFTNEEGKKVAVRHRPDALRLLSLPENVPAGGFKAVQFVRFAEYKSSSTLAESAKKGDRYIFDQSLGRYRCLAAEKAAEVTFCFGYVVLSERDLDAVIVSNVEVIHTYFGQTCEGRSGGRCRSRARGHGWPPNRGFP